MKHLKHLWTRPLAAVPNKLVIFLLIVALLGFADATYLTIEHYQGVIPPCTTNGCDTVLTSTYSTAAGIPVSLLGALYYLLVLVGVFAYLESKNTKILKWALLFTIFGLLGSLWFLYVQAFILNAYCQYCLGSAATSIVLFITAAVTLKKYQVGESGTQL